MTPKQDAFGKVLNKGDDVIFCLMTGRSSSTLYKGKILGFTDHTVRIEHIETGRIGNPRTVQRSIKNLNGIAKL